MNEQQAEWTPTPFATNHLMVRESIAARRVPLLLFQRGISGPATRRPRRVLPTDQNSGRQSTRIVVAEQSATVSGPLRCSPAPQSRLCGHRRRESSRPPSRLSDVRYAAPSSLPPPSTAATACLGPRLSEIMLRIPTCATMICGWCHRHLQRVESSFSAGTLIRPMILLQSGVNRHSQRPHVGRRGPDHHQFLSPLSRLLLGGYSPARGTLSCGLIQSLPNARLERMHPVSGFA